jgi:GcrA cell cycle regulator
MRFEAKTVIRTQTWTTERIALLKNLMDAGLSCGQIAREIGVSRNAVIGKANRLGLSRFEKPGQTGTRKNRNIAAKHRTLRTLWAKPQVAPAEAVDSVSRCSLMELREWHCRWPCGDPNSKDFGFCGNPPVDGLPYCSAHARIAYRPGTRAVARQLRCFA